LILFIPAKSHFALAEIRDVLTRPKLVAKYPALTKQAVDAFLAQHLRMATWISDVPEHYILARDPDDSMYLNLAITSGTPYVVTDDLDLLELMEPQSTTGIDFRTRYPAVQIVTPSDFEALVAKAPS
jgi:putative PIN family toxin of toxin-antitoxin system